VDVINFSISGSRTNFRDPVEIAFLYAAQAGVFVAASAGNSGPGELTVAHPGPWLTTVAAGHA
jgi:subtilisin family serine protease